jgi:hypothetical protein
MECPSSDRCSCTDFCEWREVQDDNEQLLRDEAEALRREAEVTRRRGLLQDASYEWWEV